MSSLEYIAYKIHENDLKELGNFLSELPINQLKINEFFDLLHQVLLICEQTRNEEAVKVVMFQFDNVDTNRPGALPLLTELFTRVDISPELLRFVSMVFPDRGVVELANNLIEWDGGPETRDALIKLFKVYGDMPVSVYQDLLHRADAEKNGEAILFFEAELGRREVFADVPSWVRIFPELLIDGRLPDDDNIGQYLPPPGEELPIAEVNEEKILDFLIGGYNLPVPDRRELRRLMEEQLRDPESKVRLVGDALLQQERLSLIDDTSVDRLLGLANPDPTDDLTGPGLCNAYGGCRMLCCNDYETQPFEEGDFLPVDWFTGNCDFCMRRITQRSHAARLPLIAGGWRGCFCSWEHVHNWIDWYEKDKQIWDLRELAGGSIPAGLDFIKPGDNEKPVAPQKKPPEEFATSFRPRVCASDPWEDSLRCESGGPNAWHRYVDVFASRTAKIGIQDREIILGVPVEPKDENDQLRLLIVESSGYRNVRVDDYLNAMSFPNPEAKELARQMLIEAPIEPEILPLYADNPNIPGRPPMLGQPIPTVPIPFEETLDIGGPIGE